MFHSGYAGGILQGIDGFSSYLLANGVKVLTEYDNLLQAQE
jgi:hypothetical protein